MESARAIRRLSAALMISALLGCDNVAWGGISVAIRTPPARDTIVGTVEADSTQFTRPIPTRPLLYVVERQGSTAAIQPLAEIGPNGLLALPSPADSTWWNALRAAHMSEGQEFRVFADGARVGSFTASDRTELMNGYCGATRATVGRLELLPQAMGISRFLAIGSGAATALPDPPFAPVTPQAANQATSISMMGRLISELDLRWPSDLDGARVALDVLDLGEDNPAVAATFLYRDQLSVGPAVDEAYSIFFLAISTGTQGYRSEFVRYQPVSGEGKAIPVYFSHLDWDGDGEVEILMDILGADSRWFAAVEKSEGEWAVTYEVPCQ